MSEANGQTRDAAALRTKDSLGCRASDLIKDQQFLGDDISFYRKESADRNFGEVRTLATRRGFLFGVSMDDGHQRRIHQGHHTTEHLFDRGAMYIRDFSEDYRADLSGAFDFMLMEMSLDFVDRAFSDVREADRSRLACTAGHKDPVLYHLLQAMAPALDAPDAACRVFVEQMSIALGTHVLGRYTESRHAAMTTPRVLSHAQEAKAKEMLLNGSAQTRLIEDIARECHLSPSYFIFAFRQTTGQSPYRWLKIQRIKRACELLRHTQRTLADIGMECGFADQSHFTKAFSQVMTVAPGAWRKAIGR